MIKVGITGQSGFIGTHLSNSLNLKKENITIIPFHDSYFENVNDLQSFVANCDTIVHLAAMNRHQDPAVIYNTNILLVQKLINAMETAGARPHIIFSSSSQEEKGNLYGRSKREGRNLFEQWAGRNNARFSGFIIPNVFGPFGKPFYNSVISTFCYQLTHNEKPELVVDADLKLIYVNELTDSIFNRIINPDSSNETAGFNVPHTYEIKVSEILKLLEKFAKVYFAENCFPKLNNSFESNLFNTFRSYIDHSSFYPVNLKINADQRGLFIETVKTFTGGQYSFSTTLPGVTRGNHFHTRKIERFIVIKGNARIELRCIGTNDVLRFDLNGENPSFVDMPVWFTHNITNIGDNELITLFWINEFFDPGDPDTYFEAVTG